MNTIRRKELEGIVAALEDIRESIDCILYDEQEAYDNLPESLQESERGEAMENAIDAMGDAENMLEDVISYLNDAIEV